MTLSESRIIFVAVSMSAATLVGQTVAVIRSQPLPSPQDAANLESRVLQNPENIDATKELLQYYLAIAPPPPLDSSRRAVRLQHILYLVEHHPEAAVSASKLSYVYRLNGPYASAADHEALRDQWLAAVQGHPKNNAVMMNAVRFLEVADQDDAEQLLQRAMEADAQNRELAANLGFLYAKEILGNGPDLAGHARNELEQTSNAIVLAAAGTTLPNLEMRASAGRVVDQKIFDLASELSARARQLAPDDPDIQGPMPLIQYFAADQSRLGR